MTSEKKAALIRNAITLAVIIGIPVFVFAPRHEKSKHQNSQTAQTTGTGNERAAEEITNFKGLRPRSS